MLANLKVRNPYAKAFELFIAKESPWVSKMSQSVKMKTDGLSYPQNTRKKEGENKLNKVVINRDG